MREADETRFNKIEARMRSLRQTTLQDKTTPDRTIASRYATNAGQSIENGAAAAIINFEDPIYDPFGCVTVGAAWKWTSPGVGIVTVKAMVLFEGTATWTQAEDATLYIYKNGSTYSAIARKDSISNSLGNQYMDLVGSDDVAVVTGDYLDIRIVQHSGGALALYNSTHFNHVSIVLNRHG